MTGQTLEPVASVHATWREWKALYPDSMVLRKRGIDRSTYEAYNRVGEETTMALYAFDGTGNEDREGEARDSNVLDFFNGYDDPLKNDDPKKEKGSLYLKGIGQRAHTFVGNKLAKAFGIGGHKRVRQALDRLESNIEAGDDTIDIVGFSRGAALAISFANEIADKYDTDEHPFPIRFIGVWDIVGQFGLPGRKINAGHKLDMPPNAVFCYHAMALDERRLLFPLTRLGRNDRDDVDGLLEVWFRGVHSDVGGGNGNAGLNWISLNWMFRSAMRAGLPIKDTDVDKNLAHQNEPRQIEKNTMEIGPPRKFHPGDLLHVTVKLEPGTKERPHNNPPVLLARTDDDGNVVNLA